MEPLTNRSYRLRGVRITPAQQEARDSLWAKYGVEFQESTIELGSLFPKQQPIIMEIGYGMGEATWQIAKANPSTNYLGVEVHMPGVGKLMARLDEYELTNVRLIERDVFEVFYYMITDSSLDGVHLFFPDPWPKKRHFKRRIVNERFLSDVASKLKPGGYLHIATDWVPYAEWITQVFSQTKLFTGGLVERPDWRPLTRFEGQGISKDHAVNDFRFLKA
ncbi:MAG: tRNA (guanosine(46)-N7)-methyltransferase TrmB [Actinobacteria bacterium]|uniref:tRNA (guanine(46)-N(7))-methyltransferase n=1 Tax=freshwater metagenome TaxID=449393 RepID=A0A6J6G4P4_9ZZZZ|nr:tRNA (guanosine(46)-N7)-methyltransferase TrmB [Actinomycetota bacterium]